MIPIQKNIKKLLIFLLLLNIGCSKIQNQTDTTNSEMKKSGKSCWEILDAPFEKPAILVHKGNCSYCSKKD